MGKGCFNNGFEFQVRCPVSQLGENIFFIIMQKAGPQGPTGSKPEAVAFAAEMGRDGGDKPHYTFGTFYLVFFSRTVIVLFCQGDEGTKT